MENWIKSQQSKNTKESKSYNYPWMQPTLNSSLARNSVRLPVSRRVWTKISVFLEPAGPVEVSHGSIDVWVMIHGSPESFTSSWHSSSTRTWLLGMYPKIARLVFYLKHSQTPIKYTVQRNSQSDQTKLITRILSGFLGDVDQVLRDVAVGPAHHTHGDEAKLGAQKVVRQSLDGEWKSGREHHRLALGLRKKAAVFFNFREVFPRNSALQNFCKITFKNHLKLCL